ncbi:MAG: sialidase family protein, partial [Phycisphaerae bacterium]
GHTWTFPGVLTPDVFASDPVVDADADGNFYFFSLQTERGPGDWPCYLYKSSDGGVTWPHEVYAFGGDKPWFAIDRTDGIGRGNIYLVWDPIKGCCGASDFTRSTDAGSTFMEPIDPSINPRWGTMSVGPGGELYVAGASLVAFAVARSTNAQDPDSSPIFESIVSVNLGGVAVSHTGPNPGGLLGQAWVATDHSTGLNQGHVYLLASVDPPGDDPLDVMFTRSTDGGATWSDPVRINDDPEDNGAWQWFGTMSVAPNGRIDVIWNDTRNSTNATYSELYYSFSSDGGLSWSENVAVSPPFDHSRGYPNQNKLGDYYDMASDDLGVNVAYAATFNDEQDIYFLRIGPFDCNGNGIDDETDVADETSDDCNDNNVPDECEVDCNNNGIPDECDIADGTSEDCTGNGIPDECEPDCNDNGVADSCDIQNGTSDDCNGNRVPDECDPDCDGDGIPSDCDLDEDSDDDGIDDCWDLCPDVAPPTPCVCPEFGRCCFQMICFPDYPRDLCVEQGGTPDCVESPCRDGCLMGDFDLDGDLDLQDFSLFQTCFSGPIDDPGFAAPTALCLSAFDYDGDDDIDLADFDWFHAWQKRGRSQSCSALRLLCHKRIAPHRTYSRQTLFALGHFMAHT